jgi:outer membrane protein assembly factor BamB
MNKQLPRKPALCLLIVLALALLTHSATAQRRTQAKPAQPKPTPSPAKPAAQNGQNKSAPQTQTPATQVVRRVALRWRGKPGIERYRLQVARDRDFRDIVFDRAVVGLEYQVELPAGDSFFWRVAPAAQETGEYSEPEPVNLNTSNYAGAPNAVLRSPVDVGWEAFTGPVLRPQAAPLRSANTMDIVAVNADGTVFALDGTNGSAIWTARYRPNAKRGDAPAPPINIFTPVVVRPTASDKMSVVAAFDGGVRALDGETGRELWRASLPSAAQSAVVTDLNDDNIAAELAIVTGEPALHIIDARTGQPISQAKLEGTVIGAPVPYITNATRGVAFTMTSGLLDIRLMDGARYRAVKFDIPFTTPPLIVSGPKGALIVVGTEHGLLYLDGIDLKPLGKITTEGDMPRGRLGAADLDRDGLLEIVAPMKSGSVVVVNAEGHIVWTAPGAGAAYSPVFADVDGDGMLDVLVASDRTFAVGLSGRNGALVWQVDEPKEAATTSGTPELRALTLVNMSENTTLVVSGDTARTGVRAVGLPNRSVKVAAQ